MLRRRLLIPAAVVLATAAAAPPAIAAGGDISTAAGTGVGGYAGDGAAATAALLNEPSGLAPTPDGGYLIADTQNNVVRRVDAAGSITTVAGTGVAGYNGDGIAATSAQLSGLLTAKPTADGGVLIADTKNQRIRKVSAGGKISTVAGAGTSGFAGDGGAATAAMAAVTQHRQKPRALWSSDNHGRYRTQGRNSVATARGTRWATTETCAGTRTTVTQGSVVVRDRRTGRQVVVRAGHSHLARAGA